MKLHIFATKIGRNHSATSALPIYPVCLHFVRSGITVPDGRITSYLREADAILCEVLGCPCCSDAFADTQYILHVASYLGIPIEFVSPIWKVDGMGISIRSVPKRPCIGSSGIFPEIEYRNLEEWRKDYMAICHQAIDSLRLVGV